MNFNFEPIPPKKIFIVYIAGFATAIGAIAALESWSNQLSNHQTVFTPQISPVARKNTAISGDIAILDAQSIQMPGLAVTSNEIAASKTPYIPQSAASLTPIEREMAKQAWKYFQTNWNEKTGLVNSADGFASVTLWDQSAAIAALVSAKELNLIATSDFKTKMSQMLQTLAKLPLYKNELPNKVYNSKTLLPVNYGQLEKREEIGWSAIDIGRMSLWLKIVGSRYPEFKQATETIWKSWNTQRLTKEGQMYGTKVIKGKEEYNQEGRLGYENYAAYGLKLWGLDVSKALDFQANVDFVNLYGRGIPYDRRDAKSLGANNYVLSEPYILDGIETGFQSLPKAYSDRLLAAQLARYQATKKLTALTEDNLDRPPYFVYSTLFVNGQPWATINDRGDLYNDLRFISAKAAIGWHVIYQTDYTRQLFDFVNKNLPSDRGWYNGYYESFPEPNKALTANNNGVILESLLYKQVGKPLVVWANVKSPSP